MFQFFLKKKYHFLLKWITIVWLLSVKQTGFAALSQVIAVRLWSSINYTRVTIESTKTTKYRQFFLNHPKRIIVDIKEAKLNCVPKKLSLQIHKKNPYIKEVFIRQFNSKTVRMIFLPKKNVKLHIFTLAPTDKFKDRLVVDFYPTAFTNIQNPFLILLKKHKPNETQKQIPFFVKRKSKQKKFNNDHHHPIVIMLDPGHGGEDFGAIGKYKTREKDVVLQIAHRLKALIQCESNMRVYMTRNKDIFIPLNVRVAKAQKQHTDLLISIHADAFTNRRASGSSVFTLSSKEASSIATRYLSDIQNASDIIGRSNQKNDRYVTSTMFDMVQTLTITNSLHFGKVVLNKLGGINKLHKGNVEHAGFAVLKAPNIPSILVEAAFISNIKEEKKLKTAEFQQKVAESIMKGIKTYTLLYHNKISS